MLSKLIAATIPAATRYYPNFAGDMDCVDGGGLGKRAAFVWVNTEGLVALWDDLGWSHIPLQAGTSCGLLGQWKYVGLGTQATVTSSSADTTPTFTAGDSVTLRFDEGTIFDTGDVVVALEAETTMAQVAAAINAALHAALVALGTAGIDDPSHSFVTIAASEYVLTGRAHGTSAAVEVVAFSSAGVGTTLGMTVATTNGATTGAAAGLGIQW